MEDCEEKRFKANLLALVPRLRGFARSLSGGHAQGDDLAQETVLRAWRSRATFQPDTNMEAWLFRILRNTHISGVRTRARHVAQGCDSIEETLASADDPSSRLALDDLRRALNRLPALQREALVLVGAAGWTYEQAARHTGCPIGTLKTRVFRARRTLAEYLEKGVVLRDAVRPSNAADTLIRSAEAAAEIETEAAPG